MTQPLRLSDDLLLEARLAGELQKRSPAQQIEYWAALGRALEPLLQVEQVFALHKAGKLRPVSECLRGVDTPEGRRRVSAILEQKEFPHYEPGPKGLLTRIEKNGKRATGRFVDRQFQRAD